MHLNSVSLSWKISDDFSVWKYLNARKYSSSTKYLLFKVQLSFVFYVRSLRWIKSKLRNSLSYWAFQRFPFIYCQYSLIFYPTGDSSSRQVVPSRTYPPVISHLSAIAQFSTIKVLFSFPTYSNPTHSSDWTHPSSVFRKSFLINGFGSPQLLNSYYSWTPALRNAYVVSLLWSFQVFMSNAKRNWKVSENI